MSLLLEYVGGPGSVEAICRDQTIYGSVVYGTCCFPPMQVCHSRLTFCWVPSSLSCSVLLSPYVYVADTPLSYSSNVDVHSALWMHVVVSCCSGSAMAHAICESEHSRGVTSQFQMQILQPLLYTR